MDALQRKYEKLMAAVEKKILCPESDIAREIDEFELGVLDIMLEKLE